jgi:hypothetical protein
VTIALYYYERIHNSPPHHECDLTIVLATFAAADIAAWSFGRDPHWNMRELENAPVAILYVFLVAPFYTTAYFLAGIRRSTIPFMVACFIQLTSYLSLPQINPKPRNGLVATSGAFLVLGGSLMLYEFTMYGGGMDNVIVTLLMGQIAALLRMHPFLPWFLKIFQSEYLIWTALWLIFHNARPHVDKQRYYFYVHLAMATSMVCLLGMVSYKCQSAGANASNEYHVQDRSFRPSNEKDLAALESERRRLLTLLKSFEEQFEAKHGRTVQSVGDILPMAKKYHRYKQIQREIAFIQRNTGKSL